MLELGQLVGELGAMSDENLRSREIAEEQLAVALEQAGKSGDDWAKLVERIRTTKTKWLNAVPVYDDQPIAVPFGCHAAPGNYTVLATDGSQIPLDRHASVPYFVVNVGIIALHYGSLERPTLSSDARLYFKDADILFAGADGEASYVGERQIAAARHARETEELNALIDRHAHRKDVLALVDGTLVLWAQEGDAAEARRDAVRQLVGMLYCARRSEALIAGYISKPRSREVINALRLTLYPESVTDFNAIPLDQQPGGGLSRLTDAALFQTVLEPGQRSTIFESQSRILKDYVKESSSAEYDEPESYRIAFFYVRIGDRRASEIARIECPLWLARDLAKVDALQALVVDQASKGLGYPVALQEAHEFAIIRGHEREALRRLVEQQCVRHGVALNASQKAMSKQVRFV